MHFAPEDHFSNVAEDIDPLRQTVKVDQPWSPCIEDRPRRRISR